MRRFLRWILNVLNALLVLICIAAAVIWVQSYWRPSNTAIRYHNQACESVLQDGKWTLDNKPQVQLDKAKYRDAENDLGARIDQLHARIRVMPEPERHGEDWAWKNARLAEIQGKLAAVRALQAQPRTFTIRPGFIVLACGSLALAVQLARGFVRRRRPKAGQCPKCRYDLTGNISGVCPECGTAVSA